MSRQSPTKTHAEMTELSWEPPLATAAARAAPMKQNYIDHLLSVLGRSRWSDALLAIQADPSVSYPTCPVSLDEAHIFADGDHESAPDALPLSAGWMQTQMDDTIHIVVSPVDTAVSDLWSLR
jgi:hypothetical protein